MGFTVLNEADALARDATFGDMSGIDTGDVAILAAGHLGIGVLTGCAVTQHSAPNMTVVVAAGTYRTGKGNVFTLATPITSASLAADPTNPRWYLIELTPTGTVSLNAGTPAAVPVYPTWAGVNTVVAAVRVPIAATSITNAMIVDKRAMLASSDPECWHATDFGMGTGVADGTALDNAIQAAIASAQNSVPPRDRSETTVRLKLPPGTWTMKDAANALTRITLDATAIGGTGILYIDGAGSCTLQANTNIGAGTLTVSAATPPTRTGQTVTVTFTTAHGMAAGDLFGMPLVSRGATVYNHFTVDSVPSSTSIKFQAGSVGDDGFKPATGATIDKQIPLFSHYGWHKNNWRVKWRGVHFKGNGAGSGPASNLPNAGQYDPQIGMLFHRTAGVDTEDCIFSHAFGGGVCIGTAMGSGTAQNTDHWESKRDQWTDNRTNEFIIDNQAGGGGVGGSRDWLYNNANMSAVGFSFWSVSDGGSLCNWTPSVFHGKSCSYPIYREGLDQVAPRIRLVIEIAESISFKVETPGNCAFVFDESQLSDVQKVDNFFLQERGAITISGSGANDHTHKPWPVTSVSMTGSVITATFPTGHSLAIGDAVAIGGTGNAVIDSVASYVASVSGNVITLLVPDDNGATTVSGLSGIAGMVCGWRFRLLSGCNIRLLTDVDNSDRRARIVLWKNVIGAPNSIITLVQPADPTGEVRGFGGYGFADLPSFSMAVSGAAASGSPRFAVVRGEQTFLAKIHSAADTHALTTGMQVESAATGTVQRSTTSKLAVGRGTTQQGAPAGTGAACAVQSSGTTVTNGRVWVDRQCVLCAVSPSTLRTASDVSSLKVTGSIADGALLSDNGDGTVKTVALTTGVPTAGQRIVGVAIAADASGFVDADLAAPYWT